MFNELAGWQGRRDWGEGDGFTMWRTVDAGDVALWQTRVAENPNHFELRPVYAHRLSMTDLAEALGIAEPLHGTALTL